MMQRQRLKLQGWLWLFLPFLSNCGETNLNNILFKPGTTEESYTYRIDQARISFDQGNFEEVVTITEKILEDNPQVEEAAVLLANAHLAIGGLDPFSLARNLVKINEGTATDSTNLLQSDDSKDTLTSFTALINISDTDFDKMGTISTDTELFGDEGVLYPKNPGTLTEVETPRYEVSTLRSINSAINVICPFIDQSVKDSSVNDSRYKDCATTTIERKQPARSHFLWALAHLTEALAFIEVLLYSGVGTASVLEERVATLEETEITASNLSDYLKKVTAIKENVTSVFATGEGTMLNATLNNLSGTVSAFEAIPGIPTSFTSKIKSVLTDIESKSKSLDGASDAEKKENALKGELNKKMANSLKTSLENEQNKEQLNNISDEEKQEVCDSFESLSTGTGVEAPTDLCGA